MRKSYRLTQVSRGSLFKSRQTLSHTLHRASYDHPSLLLAKIVECVYDSLSYTVGPACIWLLSMGQDPLFGFSISSNTELRATSADLHSLCPQYAHESNIRSWSVSASSLTLPGHRSECMRQGRICLPPVSSGRSKRGITFVKRAWVSSFNFSSWPC